jgi:hypothetical protein
LGGGAKRIFLKLIESNFIELTNEIGRHKREISTRRTLEFGNLVQSGTPYICRR